MIGQTFLCTTYHFIHFVSCMHASYAHQDIKWNTLSQICFLGISMGDRLEARISVIENIQEEFGHDIRKVKEHLARLTSLFEDYIKTQAVLPWGPSPVPTPICLSSKSSTIRPDYELFATQNWSPQPTATNARSSAYFRGNILTCRLAKQLKGQT